MSLIDKVEIPRRTMVLFFVIDASGSMFGSKIGAVNIAIEEVVPSLREVSAANADALVKVAALEFSTGARWLTASGPVEVDRFHWDYIEADGVTDFGAACRALNEKLSTKAFMKEATGSYAPAFFLLSDGGPTDDWQSGLNLLKQNNWFKAGVKVAVAIGDDADRDVLKAFTGTAAAILETKSATKLKKMIKFVSVRASQVASKSANVENPTANGDQQRQEELNAALREINEDTASFRSKFYADAGVRKAAAGDEQEDW